MRTEPPPSVPSANGVMPAATDAAAPALEPPGVLARFQGLRVMPVSGLVADGLAAELAGGGLADQDAAGLPGAFDRRRVGTPRYCRPCSASRTRSARRRPRSGPWPRTARRAASPAHRHASPRPRPAFAAAIACSGISRKNALSERLRRLRLVQRTLGHLDRRDLAPRDARAQLHRRHRIEFGWPHGRSRD